MLDKTKPHHNTNPPIIMTAISELFLAKEAPKGAHLQVRDSGSGSPLTDAELKASIHTNGIIEPLIFKTVSGTKFVIAGNRRLRFLREIFAEANTTEVQTRNVDDFGADDWREIAMNTNLSLPPHLVERYETIVAICKDLKLSPEDARLRYGMTPRQFAQVMALGKMSPTIRHAWKTAQIDARTAQTFTLESDPKEQDNIFAAGKKSSHNGRVDAHFVKSKIIPTSQREAGKLATFVGIDVCKKAKIIKQEDLFASDHVISDVKALNKLAGDKLAEKCAELMASGWKWAVPEGKLEGSSWSYSSLDPAKKSQPTDVEKARLAEVDRLLNSDSPEDDEAAADPDTLEDEKSRLEEEIKLRGYTAEQRTKSGCILKINNEGVLLIEYGRVKPSERKSIEASERPKKKKAKTAGAADEPALTNALAERLSFQLQTAGAEALKTNHAVAAAAIIAAISCGGHILDIRVGGGAMPRGERKAGDFGEIFIGALKSTPEQREAMLAQIAAQALSIVVFNGAGKQPLDDEGIVDLFEAMNGGHVVKHVAAAFDAKDYFATINMPSIVEAVRCVMGDDHASKVAKMKKADAAKFAAANLPAKGYLPKQLRTEWYTGPVERATEAEMTKLGKKAITKKAAKKAAKKKTKK